MLRLFTLALIAMLWAHPAVLAQGETCDPPPGVVTFKAGDADECYNDDNVYKVDISLEDFVNVDSFDVVLTYDQNKFEVLSALSTDSLKNNHPTVGAELHIDASVPGEIRFTFEEPTVRGYLDPAMDPWIIANLEFGIVNFPNNTAMATNGMLSTDLVWHENSTLYYCNEGSDSFSPVPETHVNMDDGSITATIIHPELTYTVEPEMLDCPDDMATVTITSPTGTGLMYSINGGINWQSSPVFEASSGNHTLQVMDADGCLSVKERITVTARALATFTYDIEDEKCDLNGAITFYPTGGTGEYVYYVIPMDEIDEELEIQLMLGNYEALDPYETTQSSGRAAGDYVIFIDDAAGCLSAMGVEAWSNHWVDVTIAPADVFEFSFTATAVNCYDGNDGTASVTITDGSSAGGPYQVSFNDGMPFDMVVDDDTTFIGLAPGLYPVEVSDGVCTVHDTVEVENAPEVEFFVDFTDATCSLENTGDGTLWITEINGVTDLATFSADWDYYLVDGAGNHSDTVDVTETITGLSPNNYEVYLYEQTYECVVEYVNPQSGKNNVPIFSDGVITFDPVVTQPDCYDDLGAIGVANVERSCENCNEEQGYKFTIVSDDYAGADSSWITIDETFTDLPAGDYTVYVKDTTSNSDELCMIPQTVTIMVPEPLQVMVDSIYQPTCVDGNDGWVKMYVTGGTKPYKYSVDEMPNWEDQPIFGLTEGEHLLRIEDANGCQWDSTIMVEYLSPIEITASIEPIECPGSTSPISVVLDTFTHFSNPADYRYYANETGDSFTSDDLFIPEELGTNSNPATEFAPGVYYVMAKDPYGCVSNVDTVTLEDVIPLEFLEPVVEDATCYGTWTGEVTLEVTGGNPDSVFYYAFANHPDYFEQGGPINWHPFDEDSTVVTKELQKGEYWFVVKDSCGMQGPKQVMIDGYDPIDIIASNLDITDVSCYGDASGSLVIPADAVEGGAPGYGVGNYLYTLYYGKGDIVGTAMQESNEYSNLPAGHYELFVYDTTDPDADPAMCPPDNVEFIIYEPQDLDAEVDVYHVSCNGEEDGEIHIDIWGGVGGTYDIDGQTVAAETDGNSYLVTINGITSDELDGSLLLDDDQDNVVFQVMAGKFVVSIEDAWGCEITLDTIEVMEPEAWDVTAEITEPTNCDTGDGSVAVHVNAGGFEMLPNGSPNGVSNGRYEYSNDGGETWQYSNVFGGYDYGDEDTIWVRNPYPPRTANEPCMGMVVVEIEVFNPFAFDKEAECVQCYGDENGSVTLDNITGGSGAYQALLVGPYAENVDVDPDEVGDDYLVMAGDDANWWPKDSEGDPHYTDSITMGSLDAGMYFIYLRDSDGTTLSACCRPEMIVVCEPDTLELVSVDLVNDVTCMGDSTGAISITATGGTPPYEFNYTRTTLVGDGYLYPGEEGIDDSLWQDGEGQSTDTIHGLPQGAYIGWVRDANGCITGCEINSQGQPIAEHRVVIDEADPIEVSQTVVHEPACYGGMASVELWGITGGSATTYTIMLEGTTYNGIDTLYQFGPWAAGEDYYVLDSLLASDENGYEGTIVTDAGCTMEGDEPLMVDQPDELTIEANIASGALCPGDNNVLITLRAEGGTAPYKYDIFDEDGDYDRRNTTNVNHVVYVGASYTIVVTDAHECTDTIIKEIPVPVEVQYEVRDVSCYGDNQASVWINVTQTTEGRTHMVRFAKVIPNEARVWSDWSAFDQDTVINTLSYGDESEWDGHYEFQVKDDGGCPAESTLLTFVPVQTPLQLEVMAEGATFTAHASGGAVDSQLDHHYEYALSIVDGDIIVEWQTDNTFTVEEYNNYVVWVRDYHLLCYATDTVKGGAPVHTIAEIQGEADESPLAGTMVETSGEITAIIPDAEGNAVGFTMQDANAAWSGILVHYANDFAIGEEVTVIGTVEEIDSVTTLVAEEVMETDLSYDAVAHVVEGGPSAAGDEKFESMLLKVEGVRANAADETTGEWGIYTEDDNTFVVNDWLYAYEPTEGNFYDVTGIINGMNDDYKLEPRMESDIVDLTATPADMISGDLELNVYPNPFNQYIRIENNHKVARAVISNIAGQRVLDVKYPDAEIRTAKLVSGVYVVSLFTEDGQHAKSIRMIKK